MCSRRLPDRNYYELFFEMFTCRTFDSYLHNGRVGLLKCLTALDPYVRVSEKTKNFKAEQARPKKGVRFEPTMHIAYDYQSCSFGAHHKMKSYPV